MQSSNFRYWSASMVMQESKTKKSFCYNSILQLSHFVTTYRYALFATDLIMRCILNIYPLFVSFREKVHAQNISIFYSNFQQILSLLFLWKIIWWQNNYVICKQSTTQLISNNGIKISYKALVKYIWMPLV